MASTPEAWAKQGLEILFAECPPLELSNLWQYELRRARRPLLRQTVTCEVINPVRLDQYACEPYVIDDQITFIPPGVNVAIGANALLHMSTGAQNTCLGYYAFDK